MDQAPRMPDSEERSPRLPPGIRVVASTSGLGWGGMVGLVVEGRLEDFYRHSARSTVVAFVLNGPTRVEWKRGARYTRSFCEPGSLTIVPPGGENAFRTDRASRALLWSIEPSRLREIADREWGHPAADVEIREAFNVRDAGLWALGRTLAERIAEPVPGSRLYAESVETQVAIHLLWDHSSIPRGAQAPADRPGDARFRGVIDFIHGSLGNEVSLNELADIAGLSPNYFLSAFRQATGKTPHHYLTERRVARACELLRDPHRSLVDVSLAVGFSSQSHLTTVFRRFMKTTPAAYREEVLGPRSVSRS